jgi:hypothetical protein
MIDLCKGILATLGFTAGMALMAPPPASAQDASFGCKVLLCALASAPGWSAISYCVPVMNQLFNSLAMGGGWPNCSAPNTNVSQPACYGAPFGLPMQCSVNITTSSGMQAFHYTLPY